MLSALKNCCKYFRLKHFQESFPQMIVAVKSTFWYLFLIMTAETPRSKICFLESTWHLERGGDHKMYFSFLFNAHTVDAFCEEKGVAALSQLLPSILPLLYFGQFWFMGFSTFLIDHLHWAWISSFDTHKTYSSFHLSATVNVFSSKIPPW